MADIRKIFKAYDIRGLYGSEINEDIAYRIGRAFVIFNENEMPSGQMRVIMGRDMRISSPSLSDAFAKGACDQGSDVVDIGLCSTDMLYFASGLLDLPGVMFTASHNPAEYNGLKLCKRKAAPVSDESGILVIRDLVLKNDWDANTRKGSIIRRDVMPEYVRHCHSFIDEENLSPIDIVVDAGNGMAGLLIPAVFESLPCNIIPMFFELDGSFPNHPASPIEPENIKYTREMVIDSQADLGIAFDGDADRMFLVDELGEPVSGSLTTALVSRRMLERHPGEKIIYNCICSRIVPETIRKFGGNPIRERVGHSFIKQTMADTGAIFAGEHSGHYYFRDNFRADSGLIAALLSIETICLERKSLSHLLGPFKKYYNSGELNSRISDSDTKLKELEDLYGDGKVDWLDGLTVNFHSWWFNARPSNTEPLLRLNVEASSEDELERRTKELLEVIRR